MCVSHQEQYGPKTFFAKSPGGVHLILKHPQLNEGEGAHMCCQHNGWKVGSLVPGATGRAGMQPRRNDAVSYNRDLSATLLRHLMDSRWLLADSPLHFCSVGSRITFLSGGWCRDSRQTGRHSNARLNSFPLPLLSSLVMPSCCVICLCPANFTPFVLCVTC